MTLSAYGQLESIFARIGHLNAAERTLSWERRVMMPAGGLKTRAKVLSTLRTLSNEILCGPRVRDLLDAAESGGTEKLTPWQTDLLPPKSRGPRGPAVHRWRLGERGSLDAKCKRAYAAGTGAYNRR